MLQPPEAVSPGCLLVSLQRNVGNLATHKDMNIMACIEYAVQGKPRIACYPPALPGTRSKKDICHWRASSMQCRVFWVACCLLNVPLSSLPRRSAQSEAHRAALRCRALYPDKCP